MLTLDEILQFEPLLQAQAEVLVGGESLDNAVVWVHICEMESLAHIFDGGELLLTQGRGIPRTPRRQRAWVQALADAGVSGVAIERGHVLDEVPAAIVEQAAACSLPLIHMQRPAYFIEITRAVHSVIIGSQHDASMRVEEFSRRLARLMMAGGGLQEALDEVASALSHPVALTGPNHFLEFVSPRNDPGDTAGYDWRRHTKHDHDLSGSKGACVTMQDGGRCLHRAIVFRGEIWGCLHVLLGDWEPNDLLFRVLDQAAISLGLSHAVQQNLNSVGTDYRSEIIHELITTTKSSANDLQRRLHWLGLDPFQSLRVVLAAPIDSVNENRAIANERRRFGALQALGEDFRDALGPGAVVGYLDDMVVALVADDGSLESLGAWVENEKTMAIIGASGQSSSVHLVRARKEANEAVLYAQESGQGAGLYWAERLVLQRALLKLNEDGTLNRLVEQELEPILDYDERAQTSLLLTLEAYFDCVGRRNEMAQVLHVDRRTVHHRMARISELIGETFDQSDKQLSLHIAVRGYRLLAVHR
ncbi:MULTISPECIES: PucR family transcriptional regulator [unclassified Brevibacterium]|uniref:PucR family transcriptional regulator n=1 Tax=unclassified Brevibacterium TaxID=2614124 RepID=UPI0010926663|nr:PucR family transcriptional regulator [Brevibacterium sp. S22]TGD31002.1 PucR family transcriptional regulator [Brevibacterium sp. S22]